MSRPVASPRRGGHKPPAPAWRRAGTHAYRTASYLRLNACSTCSPRWFCSAPLSASLGCDSRDTHKDTMPLMPPHYSIAQPAAPRPSCAAPHPAAAAAAHRSTRSSGAFCRFSK
eukprot:691054-Prymnesium_polylepis.1